MKAKEHPTPDAPILSSHDLENHYAVRKRHLVKSDAYNEGVGEGCFLQYFHFQSQDQKEGIVSFLDSCGNYEEMVSSFYVLAIHICSLQL